jgi:hypothetical protein
MKHALIIRNIYKKNMAQDGAIDDPPESRSPSQIDRNCNVYNRRQGSNNHLEAHYREAI